MLVVGIPLQICKEAVSLFSQELQQHDVQELNRILFAAIESSLVGTSGEHLIGQLYRGTAVQQVNHSQLNLTDTVEPLYKDTPEIWTPLSKQDTFFLPQVSCLCTFSVLFREVSLFQGLYTNMRKKVS